MKNRLAAHMRREPMLPEVDMAGLLDRLFGRMPAEMPSEEMGWVPPVDITEIDKGLMIRVDLPGVELSKVELTVVDRVLVIKGERLEPVEEKPVHVGERLVGPFYRAIPLPEMVDPGKITASGTNGVLTLLVPRRPESGPFRIEVKEA